MEGRKLLHLEYEVIQLFSLLAYHMGHHLMAFPYDAVWV